MICHKSACIVERRTHETEGIIGFQPRPDTHVSICESANACNAFFPQNCVKSVSKLRQNYCNNHVISPHWNSEAGIRLYLLPRHIACLVVHLCGWTSNPTWGDVKYMISSQYISPREEMQFKENSLTGIGLPAAGLAPLHGGCSLTGWHWPAMHGGFTNGWEVLRVAQW